MAESDQVEWLKSGRKMWNDRRALVDFKPDLKGLDFRNAISDLPTPNDSRFFKGFNFSKADLRGAELSDLDFSNANFSSSDLSEANLQNGIFHKAKFRRANLSNAYAQGADFEGAVFSDADFEGANLLDANLSGTNLRGANISRLQLENSLKFEIDPLENDREFPVLYDRMSTAKQKSEPPLSPKEHKRGRYLVLFGTNRKPLIRSGKLIDFGTQRDEKLNLGSCEVFIPESHKVGSIGSPFWKRVIRGDDRIQIRKLIALNGQLYWKLVRENFSDGDQSCPPTMFIHGYNTDFKEAIVRAAQIGFDLGLETGISLFSWPSRSSAKNYSADEATVEFSRDFLVEFILGYLDSNKSRRLNLIAHSMGCRCLAAALENIALTKPRELKKINQIIFAAADVDQGLMRRMGTHLVKNSGRTTSYACPKDTALGASSWLHSFPRVGLLPPVFLLDKIDTVEVEKTDLIGLGHGYVAGAKSVLNDMFQLIEHSIPPERRFSIQSAGISDASHWRLKE